MDTNQTPEQRMRLIIMSVGAINALLGAVIVSIYFGLLPIDISYLDIPNWVIGVLGLTWFLSGVGVVAFTAMRFNK
ncbi:MAG: hypothetical protein ABIQ77_05490 [Anaerolineales bacterium]